MEMNFSPREQDELKYYVYYLLDPRNGRIFYVGKGSGNRVFQHLANTTLPIDDSDDSENLEADIISNSQQIRDIENAGLSVIRIIHRHGMTEDEALHVEASLIDMLGDLNNKQSGHYSGTLGPRNVAEISMLYGLPDFPSSEEIGEDKLILININKIEDWSNSMAIYNQVRGNWRINKWRADKADYVIAVRRGVAIGVFQKDGTSWDWKSVTGDDRKQFTGKNASNAIWEKYVGSQGKRISNPNYRHVRSPIRYNYY